MRLTTAIVFIVASLLASGVPAAVDRDLNGDYAMNGTSLRPNSRPYVGVCTLKLSGPVYDVNCTNTDSGDRYVGKGLQRGDIFCLYLGEYLVVYHVEADGRLVGNWAHSRSDDYGQETLTPKKN